MKITIKSVLFGVIGRVIPRNLRVFTFEKREILRFGCIFGQKISAKPHLLEAASAETLYFTCPRALPKRENTLICRFRGGGKGVQFETSYNKTPIWRSIVDTQNTWFSWWNPRNPSVWLQLLVTFRSQTEVFRGSRRQNHVNYVVS